MNKILISFSALFALLATSLPCNIPVFRYALERWRPDSCELIVFHDAKLSTEQEDFVRELESIGQANRKLANAKIIRSNVGENSKGDYLELWESIKETNSSQLPYVVVRTRLGREQTINHWHGSLDEAQTANLLDSPVRRELGRRLLRGDSIVWLLLQSPDEKRTKATRKRFETNFEKLEKSITLPQGIGLPGSELHSEVPLVVKYSLLEIDPNDEKEQFMVRLLTGFEPQAVAAGEVVLVPVFGRGRALEVIPARELSNRLIEEISLFLVGACSCQVKEQNPGFDLLMTENWEKKLFGENGTLPPPAKKAGDRARSPELLTIPPGRKSGQ